MRVIRLCVHMCCVAALATLSTFHVLAEDPWSAVLANADARSAAVHGGAQRQVAAARNRVMTLDPMTAEEASARSMLESKTTSQSTLPAPLQTTPDNFRRFAPLSKGQIGETQTLTLRFAAGAKLTVIKSTPDFKVEQGGSCVEGYTFVANSTCTLLVRSTPQGPGNRLGKLEITNSVDATPLYVGLGGNGYSPTISFTPSIISTVPGTYVSGAGTISGSTSLAVDGGDGLYIADTGHNEIEVIDSSGTVRNATASFGATAPISVVVDHSGFTYFTQREQYFFLYILPNPNTETYYGSSTTSCAFGATCPLNGANIPYSSLGALASDPNGNIFLNTFQNAARLVPSPSIFSLDYIPLALSYSYNSSNYTFQQPLAVDSSDTLYSFYNDGTSEECAITGDSYYNAYSDVFSPVVVVGGKSCGFSGDGGQARSAEIGKQVDQMAFDIAGNFYFTDTLNQRVRRVDNATGIITTIAGNGSTGYYGDGGPATAAALNTPAGVAVDSQGQVYILSNSATTGTAQVVRKVGVVGALNLGSLAVGSASTAQTVTLANTGNSDLDFTHVGLSSGNTSDFSIDSNTTNCNFTVALAAGRSCKIGFIFTPSATGTRSAVLSITDDTIAGVNTIQLSGAGFTSATLTPASFSFASTSVGSSTAAQVATLTNTGKAAMTISGIALSGPGATSYVKTTTCGTTLGVGASCTISITFKPTAVGSLPATLTVMDNAITVNQTVALTGTGSGAASATLAPSSFFFTSTKVGSSSAAQTAKLSNTGTAALAITSIKMTGTNAADFVLTQACGTSIAAGGMCSMTVAFKPTATGSRSATLTAVTSAGTLTTTMTGTGAAATAVTTPKVTLASADTMMKASKTLVLTARVAAGSTALPSGTVHLMDGSRMISGGVLQNGAATFKITGLSNGKHMLQAIYMGDTHHRSARSQWLEEWIASTTRSGPVVRAPGGISATDAGSAF